MCEPEVLPRPLQNHFLQLGKLQRTTQAGLWMPQYLKEGEKDKRGVGWSVFDLPFHFYLHACSGSSLFAMSNASSSNVSSNFNSCSASGRMRRMRFKERGIVYFWEFLFFLPVVALMWSSEVSPLSCGKCPTLGIKKERMRRLHLPKYRLHPGIFLGFLRIMVAKTSITPSLTWGPPWKNYPWHCHLKKVCFLWVGGWETVELAGIS